MQPLHAAPLLALAAAFLVLISAGETRAEQTTVLWLPWEGGSLWSYTQGPHGQGTEGIDLQPPDASGKPCETFHSSFWITAAADGTVLSERPNTLEIDHGNGFVTGYYHIEHEQVRPGDKVAAGQKLGLPGCCPDGWGVAGCWSTAPHLHFYTTFRGVRQSIVGINLGGWRVGEDGCMYRTDQVSCPLSGRIVSNSPRQGQNSPSTPADLAVIVDTSSSSGENQGPTRNEAAMAVLQATRVDDRVSVVQFNSSAHVAADLKPAVTNEVMDASLVSAVATADSTGRTNLRLGLVTGCAHLLANGKAPTKAAILISDGKHNMGKFSAAEECFNESGIPVFTFGVGISNNYLLRRIATKTGGEFKRLSEVENLYCEFLRVRTLLSGDPPGRCTTSQVKQGQSVTLPFTVPSGQDQAILEIRWRERRTAEQAAAEGIPLTTQLISPSGRTVPNDFPGITYTQSEDGVRYTIAYPLPGEWKLVVTANEKAPPEGVFVTFSASTIPQAPPFVFLPEEQPAYDETPTPEGETPTPEATTETPTEGGEEATPTRDPDDTSTPRPTRTPVPSPSETERPSRTPDPVPSETEPPPPPTEPPPTEPPPS